MRPSILWLLTLLSSINCSSHHSSIKKILRTASRIADPNSPDFRKFLSADQAAELAKGLPTISFNNNTSQRRSNRAKPQRSQQKSINLDKRDTCGTDGLVTPSCIQQVYKIDHIPQPSRVTFAIYATESAAFNPQDVTTFLQQNRPEAANASYIVVGSSDSPSIEGQFETALDTQTALGTAWPAQGILYNLGGVFGPDQGKPFQPFYNFLQDLIHNETIPSVISFSESMPEDMVDPDYAKALCWTMALVGARGVSLLFSSGDNGPNGDTSGGVHNKVFEPEFPAGCPWVTAVGGTSNIADETAATSSTIPVFDSTFYTASGGGFSELFSRPQYQDQVVSEYIEQHVPSSYSSVSGFNVSGRGLPDISAFSTNVPVSYNGITLPLGGTSASTPLWAAVIAVLNDYEASQGRPALGFLNPWLYSLKYDQLALKDITTGGNSKGGCNVLTGCHLDQTLGYDVASGWDAVTGIGSPLFGGLVEALDDAEADCE